MPFPRLDFLKAHLRVGFVDLPTHKSEDDDDDIKDDRKRAKVDTEESASNEGMMPPCTLERSETMSSRILEIETIDDDSEPSILAFWLQRKLSPESSSRSVIARLGYQLRPHEETKKWELDTDASGQPILVRVHMLRSTVVADGDPNAAMNELGALSMIAKQNCGSCYTVSEDAHVVGTNLVAKDDDDDTIYAILPYHRDGTLLEFCHSNGNLPEPLARFIFRQILEVRRDRIIENKLRKSAFSFFSTCCNLYFASLQCFQGLKTLKSTGICHRNLSLDSIALDGDRVDIVGLGWALRHDVMKPTANAIDGSADDENNRSHPPLPGGSDPRFITPESFGFHTNGSSSRIDSEKTTTVWNGFRDDLWAAGLILYSMVMGTDALFAAPIAGDKHFARLCIKGDVKGEIERYWKRLGKDASSLPSGDLVNLLQSMLSVDPTHRPTLETVMKDPWVRNIDISITPTGCYEGMPSIGL